MNCIETKDLEKAFGRERVLKKISMQVAEGSIHGFLGPNGAGKTTAIKTILGLYRPDGGYVKLFGEPVKFGNIRPHLSSICYLPQDPVFPEQYSGIEVMEMIAAFYNIPKAERIEQIKSILKEFDLLKAGGKAVKTFSRGMKQRVGLATVWLPKPKLMILDEPVSALDPEGRYLALEKIKEAAGETTVFFSSHILSDVERVADNITILSQGSILLHSSMAEIRNKYVSSSFILKVPPEKVAATEKLLAQIPEVISFKIEQRGISIQVDSSKVELAGKRILRAVLAEDITVMRFAEQEATLEDVFMQLINGGESDEADALA
ncbi:MAG TPA: ABC transporter ATP-binding protein [Firmicutes bacterium]|nr:ABC transporter ATP-binding protein [Bacillota bacterium]